MSTLLEIRAVIDPMFSKTHRELTDCYYQKKPFRELGVLTESQFKKLHCIIKDKRLIAFHEANLKFPKKDQVPQADYNSIIDDMGTVVGTYYERCTTRVDALKTDGFDLEIR